PVRVGDRTLREPARQDDGTLGQFCGQLADFRVARVVTGKHELTGRMSASDDLECFQQQRQVLVCLPLAEITDIRWANVESRLPAGLALAIAAGVNTIVGGVGT